MRLGLAGKTRHDRGAQRRPGQGLPDAPHRVQNLPAAIAPSHAAQHLVMAVLDGEIQVGENPGVGGHGVQELRGDPGRMAVQEANPPEAVNGGQLPQQRRDARVAGLLPAIGGGVLGHQDEFFDPGRGQLFGLPHQGVRGAGCAWGPGSGG